MVYVGMIYNPKPRSADEEALSKPCDARRYLAGLYDLDELGLQMRRQGGQVGMNAADLWIALSDAGNGLEAFIDRNFPGAEKILDFQHGATHLAAFAKQFRPDTSERLLAAWCHTLKHAGGAMMIRVLERLDRKKMTEEVRKGHEDVLGYLRKNVERMDYPRYLRNGWQIASGAVESACKTVVNQRLCLGGMRWGEEGSDAVAHLQRPYIAATLTSGTPSGATLWPRDGKTTHECHAYPSEDYSAASPNTALENKRGREPLYSPNGIERLPIPPRRRCATAASAVAHRRRTSLRLDYFSPFSAASPVWAALAPQHGQPVNFLSPASMHTTLPSSVPT